MEIRSSLTPKILRLCTEISLLLGKLEGLPGFAPQPQLRRSNQIKTIQGSVAIEGNKLSIEQVTALIEGKRVMGSPKDILEVQNAIRAYGQLAEFNPFSIQSFLDAHRALMEGLVPDAGKWRSGSVGILKGGKVSHIAPKAHYVQGMVKELLHMTKRSELPLVASCVFHHQMEWIHPFSDGNGRMGRLWQHVLLYRFHPVFEFVATESVVRERQPEYYRALEQSDAANDSAHFTEFMLSAILQSFEEFSHSITLKPLSSEDRIQIAREKLAAKPFSRKDYQALFPRLSTATASRDLALGCQNNALTKEGDKRMTLYTFKKRSSAPRLNSPHRGG